jgi:hypothetical protein
MAVSSRDGAPPIATSSRSQHCCARAMMVSLQSEASAQRSARRCVLKFEMRILLM